MEVFDKDGNPIEGVFSKEEVDAQIEEAKQAAVRDAKSAAEAEDNKNKKDNEVPEWAKPLFDNIESLKTHNSQSYLGKVTAGLDADKVKDVEAKYKNLTGYEETPEGIARRSEDAYLLATGTKYNEGTVDMSNLAAAGGGKTSTDPKITTESDNQIRAALGITQGDVDKYGKK